MSSVNPCKESYLVQVHGVVSEVHGALIKMFSLVASPSSGRQVDIPLLLPWLQHRSHHQVIPDQELGVDLVGGLVVDGDPPEGPYDWVSCVKDLACQLEDPWGHQSLVKLCELLCYLYNLQIKTQRYRVSLIELHGGWFIKTFSSRFLIAIHVKDKDEGHNEVRT